MKYWLFVIFLWIQVAASCQDLTLEYFIQQARQNSPQLKEFAAQILSNQLDSQLLRASLKTQVNFVSTNSYAPVIKGWGYDEAITNGANISALLQANRNFISANNLTAQYRVIALQNRALLDTIQLSVYDLVRTITEQYISTYGDQLTIDFNLQLYTVLQKENEALKKLTQASVMKQTDYLAFYVTMQQQELTLLQAQIQYNTDYLTLNYLCGIVDTTISHLAPPVIDTAEHNFYESTFYQRFTTDSLRLANERRLIDYQYKPKIGAYTDAGYNSSLILKPYKNFGFSFGVSLIVPIYDAHQKTLKYQKLDLQERTRLANREYFLSQYQQQLNILKQQLASTNLLVTKINQQITYTNTLIEANNKLLETGDITMRDYVLAITSYLNTRNLLTQNNISRLRIINQLNYWNR